MDRCNGEFLVSSVRATRIDLLDGRVRTLKDIVLVPIKSETHTPMEMPQNLVINNLVDDDVQLGDRFLVELTPLNTMGDVIRAAFPGVGKQKPGGEV